MSVNAEDFLRAAEQLISHNSHEIDYRSSMSRAYYATFHALAPLADQLPAAANYTVKGSHDEKISKLTSCLPNHPQARLLKAIGYEIQKSKSRRVIADYKIDNVVTQNDAQEQLDKAKYLLIQIADLKTVLQTP